MEAWIWLNEWTCDGLEILGVFTSLQAADTARDKAPLTERINSRIEGPFTMRSSE